MGLAALGDFTAIIGVLSIAAIVALIVVANVLTKHKAASAPRVAPAFAVRTASDPVPGHPTPVLEYAAPPERIVLKYEMTREELLLISRLPKSGPPADPSKDPVLHQQKPEPRGWRSSIFGWL